MQLRIAGLIACVLLFGPLVTVDAQDTRPPNEVEVRGVYAIPSGEASFASNGTAGDVISFERDFDFRKELGFAVRFTHRTENVTFRGETFTANLDPSADLRLSDFRVMYAYRWGNEKIRIGPMVDMGVVSTRLNNLGAIAFQGERLFHTEGELRFFQRGTSGLAVVISSHDTEWRRTTISSL